MTSRSYFSKMNSTLGSVVPLAMFGLVNLQLDVGEVVEIVLVALKTSLQSRVGALVTGVVHRVQLQTT